MVFFLRCYWYMVHASNGCYALAGGGWGVLKTNKQTEICRLVLLPVTKSHISHEECNLYVLCSILFPLEVKREWKSVLKSQFLILENDEEEKYNSSVVPRFSLLQSHFS